jgi:hypothetical protein
MKHRVFLLIQSKAHTLHRGKVNVIRCFACLKTKLFCLQAGPSSCVHIMISHSIAPSTALLLSSCHTQLVVVQFIGWKQLGFSLSVACLVETRVSRHECADAFAICGEQSTKIYQRRSTMYRKCISTLVSAHLRFHETNNTPTNNPTGGTRFGTTNGISTHPGMPAWLPMASAHPSPGCQHDYVGIDGVFRLSDVVHRCTLHPTI